MALLRAVASRFFKGQIFFPTEKIKITDRSLVIRFSQNRINNDSNAVAEGQGIGWIPSRCGHRADDLFLGSHERNVEWNHLQYRLPCGSRECCHRTRHAAFHGASKDAEELDKP